MTDYLPLIARAVDGLDRSTGEARRSLYERARSALVTQLRGVDPPLSESEITKERLALEDAIRKVEADAARKARSAPAAATPPRRDRNPPADTGRADNGRTDTGRADSGRMDSGRTDAGRSDGRRAESPMPRGRALDQEGAETQRPAAPQTARERLLSARAPAAPAPSRQGARAFRDIVGEAHDLGGASARSAQSARDTRDSYGAPPPPYAADDEAADGIHSIEPEFAEDAPAAPYTSRLLRRREPVYEDDEADGRAAPNLRLQADDDLHQPRPPRSYRGLVKLLVALIVLLGLAATISWQWPHISGLYQFIAQHTTKQQQAQTPRDNSGQSKFNGRIAQDQPGSQAPGAAPGGQAVPAVAQRVVLYEEDSNDPQGKRYVGSVIWRTETVSPGPGLAPELAVRADVEIPERRITMTWSLRRNTDQALPASHTIEILFNLPADFAGGGIANVPGILMKQSEQARGTPLAGLAVKVTNGFFLIGLSAVDTDVQRNVQLLKERPWFDLPVVYTNGGRAILAMEKGPPGDRAFTDAFAAWEKK